jgi:hypothetical protein
LPSIPTSTDLVDGLSDGQYIHLVWEVELSAEVDEWYCSLGSTDRAQADRVFDLLTEHGPKLRMPHAKYLAGKLYELRFRCEGVNRRITYTVEGAIVTLTTFRKQRQNEAKEVARARRVLARRARSGNS